VKVAKSKKQNENCKMKIAAWKSFLIAFPGMRGFQRFRYERLEAGISASEHANPHPRCPAF